MTHHPYQNFPETQFWSSGVKVPVSSHNLLTIDTLIKSIGKNDLIVSGGSCFAQYIGQELIIRGFHYLRSQLSGERTESFGIGNIYTIAQLKQWLEFSLGYREWGTDCIFESNEDWYDLLLPHRDAMPSEDRVHEHRGMIKSEILENLKNANYFILTVGLTEAWRSPAGDIYPLCPGTLRGEYDASKHLFHNFTFDEIRSDLVAVENYLAEINSNLKLIYTVSPVPLTATATDHHVLLATSYSKSVIRAAIGQYCNDSEQASYFPSYELISHHFADDWRFEKNLRSISKVGVGYVMEHAFGDVGKQPLTQDKEYKVTTSEPGHDAICEEELLESFSRLQTSAETKSSTVLVGDCHMGKLASGFKTAGIDVIGGIVMHGSSFTDNKFELSKEQIFRPLDSQESVQLWADIYNRLVSLKGRCNIITNIGFQTHRTINIISNHLKVFVLTENDIAEFFHKHFAAMFHILSELTKYGQVWMIEDPDFYALIRNRDNAQIVRDKNFHQYCMHMRSIAQQLGINYLNPCDATMQNMLKDSKGLIDIIDPVGLLGTQKYYEYCATVVNDSINNNAIANAQNVLAQAA